MAWLPGAILLMPGRRARRWLGFVAALASSKLSAPARGMAAPRAMVLQSDDVPSGWEIRKSREWRTGFTTTTEPWAARVRAAKGRSYAVAYGSNADDWLGIVSGAVPLMSADDAAAAFPAILDRALLNPDPRVVLKERREIALGDAIGDEHAGQLLIVENIAYPGTLGEQYVIAWRNERVISWLSVCGRRHAWSTTEILEYCRAQDRRVRGELSRIPKS